MSELAFTLARFGFLALLWVFVLAVVRVLRRDVADTPAPANGWWARRRTRRAQAPATAAGQAPAVPRGRRRRQPSRLVITEGPLAGSTVPLTPSVLTIGRDPSCSLVLEDSYASSVHARIFPGEGRWWLEDLGSTNGTTLSGVPVTSTVALPVGAPVRIGQTTLELRP